MAHKQQQKQIFENKYNKVKNPKQLKANQLDIYKQDQGVEQIELAVRVGIELRAARLQYSCKITILLLLQHTATLPPLVYKRWCQATVGHSKGTASKLFLLEISTCVNCSSEGCLKCVQFHNWFRLH